MRLVRSLSLLELTRILTCEEIPSDMVGHIGGFRSAIELGLIPEIIARVKKTDIDELYRIYRRMENELENLEDWYQLDCKFHERLIAITGNKMAGWFWHLLDPFFKSIAPSKFHVERVPEKQSNCIYGLSKRLKHVILLHLKMQCVSIIYINWHLMLNLI